SSLRLELEHRDGKTEQQVSELSVAVWRLGSRLDSQAAAPQDVVASRQRLLEERLRAFEELIESEIEDRAKEYRRLWKALGERSGERLLQAAVAGPPQSASPRLEQSLDRTPPPWPAEPPSAEGTPAGPCARLRRLPPAPAADAGRGPAAPAPCSR
ncbi:unnamed protein product, partial [Prorocentrum cordatum]